MNTTCRSCPRCTGGHDCPRIAAVERDRRLLSEAFIQAHNTAQGLITQWATLLREANGRN